MELHGISGTHLLCVWERITTALSGLYWMPKAAFIFAGYVEQPLVLLDDKYFRMSLGLVGH